MHGSKVVFWAFGFEAINDSIAGSNSQKQTMTAVLSWFGGITAVPDFSNIAALPSAFVLQQNYPNPFNPSTQIAYGLTAQGHVTLKVYDVIGREVAEVVNSVQSAGWHSARFDASNLASGVYYYTLKAGNLVESKKMLLLK